MTAGTRPVRQFTLLIRDVDSILNSIEQHYEGSYKTFARRTDTGQGGLDFACKQFGLAADEMLLRKMNRIAEISDQCPFLSRD